MIHSSGVPWFQPSLQVSLEEQETTEGNQTSRQSIASTIIADTNGKGNWGVSKAEEGIIKSKTEQKVSGTAAAYWFENMWLALTTYRLSQYAVFHEPVLWWSSEQLTRPTSLLELLDTIGDKNSTAMCRKHVTSFHAARGFNNARRTTPN